MFNLFGSKQTAAAKKEQQKTADKERLREWQRKIRSEMRGFDREISKLQREEEKMKKEIKALAAKGQMAPVKIMVQNLVKSKKTVERLYITKAQMNSVAMEMQSMASTMKLADSMGKSANIMKSMNALCQPSAIQKDMLLMQKEMMRAGLIQETMEEGMDMMADDEEEELADTEMEKVLAELAIEGLGGAVAAPTASAAQAKAVSSKATPAQESAEDELLKRLEAL